MERMSLNNAVMKYPKQYFVTVNVNWEGNALFGDIHSFYSNHEDARKKMIELDKQGTWGQTGVCEGFDDTPQIGGLFRI